MNTVNVKATRPGLAQTMDGWITSPLSSWSLSWRIKNEKMTRFCVRAAGTWFSFRNITDMINIPPPPCALYYCQPHLSCQELAEWISCDIHRKHKRKNVILFGARMMSLCIQCAGKYSRQHTGGGWGSLLTRLYTARSVLVVSGMNHLIFVGRGGGNWEDDNFLLNSTMFNDRMTFFFSIFTMYKVRRKILFRIY